jgi:hypothetical protein
VDAPPDPLRGPAFDSAYLADYLRTITGPIILVGHSYSGAVINNAATGNPDVKAPPTTCSRLPSSCSCPGGPTG